MNQQAKDTEVSCQKDIEGVCSSEVRYTIDKQGLVRNVSFEKGCHGNSQAVAILAEGRPATELISLLEGVKCSKKDTSCPDQFAQALKESLQHSNAPSS